MSANPPAATGPAHGRRIAVIGLGYVGLPVAAAFGERGPVIAFDSDATRIEELRRGVDRNATVGAKRLAAPLLELTRDPRDLGRADFFIVAVPTPVDAAKHPDLGALEAASRTVGGEIRPGAIVVYESTVYPGATEDVCIPILEEASGLRAGRDFFVGYSPERINPGDEAHGFAQVVKVVAAGDPDTLETVAGVYGSVVEAGVHRAPSIRVAEAAKVIENTQRDINIALMNEVAMIFDRLGIDTGDVLAAAGTKWNFLPFRPGLVGGHCIGVDPYYLTHEAMRAGHHPEVILSGRRINDEIGSFVATSVVRLLIQAGATVRGAVVTVLGAAFKENVPDVRNSEWRASSASSGATTWTSRSTIPSPTRNPLVRSSVSGSLAARTSAPRARSCWPSLTSRGGGRMPGPWSARFSMAARESSPTFRASSPAAGFPPGSASGASRSRPRPASRRSASKLAGAARPCRSGLHELLHQPQPPFRVPEQDEAPARGDRDREHAGPGASAIPPPVPAPRRAKARTGNREQVRDGEQRAQHEHREHRVLARLDGPEGEIPLAPHPAEQGQSDDAEARDEKGPHGERHRPGRCRRARSPRCGGARPVSRRRRRRE